MSVKVKKRSGQWGMSNLFQKNSNFSAIFRRNLAEKFFGRKLSQLNWMVFHGLVQKY